MLSKGEDIFHFGIHFGNKEPVDKKMIALFIHYSNKEKKRILLENCKLFKE